MEQLEDRPLAVRPAQAARLTGLSERKIRALIAEGRLESVRVDAARLVPMRAVERLVGAPGLAAS